MKLPSQSETFRHIRRLVFLELKPKAERPLKVGGYRRRPKHKKDFAYEIESE